MLVENIKNEKRTFTIVSFGRIDVINLTDLFLAGLTVFSWAIPTKVYVNMHTRRSSVVPSGALRRRMTSGQEGLQNYELLLTN